MKTTVFWGACAVLAGSCRCHPASFANVKNKKWLVQEGFLGGLELKGQLRECSMRTKPVLNSSTWRKKQRGHAGRCCRACFAASGIFINCGCRYHGSRHSTHARMLQPEHGTASVGRRDVEGVIEAMVRGGRRRRRGNACVRCACQ